MIVVDASVWASIFLKTDRNNNKARRWFEGIGKTVKIVVPSIAQIEIACTLSRLHNSPDFINECLSLLDSVAHTQHLNEELWLASIKIGIKHKTKGADTIYVALAHKLGADLVTLDKEQAKKADSLINIVCL